MDIEGLGGKLVEQLVERELVRNPADLYALDVRTLASLERMAEKSAANVHASIERSRRVELQRFIYALGIPGVGEEVAKLLARHFATLDAFRSVDWPKLMADKEALRKDNAQRRKRGEPAREVPLDRGWFRRCQFAEHDPKADEVIDRPRDGARAGHHARAIRAAPVISRDREIWKLPRTASSRSWMLTSPSPGPPRCARTVGASKPTPSSAIEQRIALGSRCSWILTRAASACRSSMRPSCARS